MRDIRINSARITFYHIQLKCQLILGVITIIINFTAFHTYPHKWISLSRFYITFTSSQKIKITTTQLFCACRWLSRQNRRINSRHTHKTTLKYSQWCTDNDPKFGMSLIEWCFKQNTVKQQHSIQFGPSCFIVWTLLENVQRFFTTSDTLWI